MARDHYILWYRLDLTDRYAIWHSDWQSEDDPNSGVVIDGAGKIANFGSAAQAERYAASRPLPIVQEAPILHDLDAVSRWLQVPRKKTVDCVGMLTAWNLFESVSRSVRGGFDPDPARTAKIYDKLFWGNNLPAVTPPGECYEPVWTKSEVGIMSHVLGNGLSIFRRHLAE